MIENPIYIHGYVNPELLNKFKSGEITQLEVYSKKFKGELDSIHISVPLGKARKIDDAGFILYRTNFIAGETF